jgi:tetratricopeptide (TPR) repeat protein/transcriptional regulator with XRE-family HTH domain
MDTMQPRAFGTLLRRRRIAAGLTQEELAERAGLSVRRIGDMERGIQQRPRTDTLALLAEALGLSPEEQAGLAEAARRLRPSAPVVPGYADASTPPLVGRQRELALLERHLAGQGPQVLLLAGEPGIGKTRLLHAAIPRALAHGYCVLEGGCQRLGGHEPYAPLLGALQGHLRARSLVQLRADLQGCAWLVRLLPELAAGPIEPLPAWKLPPEQERRLMVAAVVRFLTNVAGPMGTLLLLDDLQWAGPDALDLLTALARSTPELSLRIAGAYRDTEVQPQHPLAVLLADLAHAGLAAQRLLGPLSPEEAGQLLATLLPEEVEGATMLRERVVRRAGGVPFYLVSCAQSLRLGEPEGAPPAVPWEVAQGIRQRVATLPQAAQEVLGAAAVAVGRMAHPALLTAVVDYPEREVLAALEAAWRARLLEETDGAHRFAHDLIREVVEGDLSATRRMVLHRRMAQALEREPGKPPVEALAYHYAQCDAQDKALLYLEQAGDRAATQYANASAEGYYRDLVARLDRLGSQVDAALGREKLGAVLNTMGAHEAALVAFDQAVAVYQVAGDQEGMRRALAEIGLVHADQGTPRDGLARLQPLAAPGAVSEPSPGLAAVYTALTFLLRMAGRYADAVATAEQAVDLARAVRDDRLLGAAEWHRGTALTMFGRFDEARGALEAAIALLEAAGDLARLCEALGQVGDLYEDRGDFARALLYTDRALAAAEQSGVPLMIAALTSGRGVRAFYAGDWVTAHLYCERAVILGRETGIPFASMFALLHLGQLCLYQGSWEEAARYLEESSAIARGVGHLSPMRWAQALLADCDLQVGRPEAARGRLVPLLDGVSVEEAGVLPMLLVLARAQLELGETDQAAAGAGQSVRHARETNSRRPLAEALWVQALVALRQEDAHTAERALEEGLTLAQAMPYPLGEARLLHVHGLLHIQQGEPAPARERLEAALAIFRQLGAGKDLEQTEALLTGLG